MKSVVTNGAPPDGHAGGRPTMLATVRVNESAEAVRYDVQVSGVPAPGPSRLSFFLEAVGDVVPGIVERYDFVVLALIYLAMRKGADLHVEGPVSRDLLVNLEEFQRAWAAWVPWRYRRVRLTCDEEVGPKPGGDSTSSQRSAVLAFSGGVDSLFAMLDILDSRHDRDGCELKTAVLIHGFDVGLEESEGFSITFRDARRATGAVGVPLSVVRTDMRSVLAGEWPHEFGAAVAACLALFMPVARRGYLASDHAYSFLRFPWGSNCITNPLMSSASFHIVTWGSAITRTGRVARIARHGAIADRVRVCWIGKRPGENCGVCEKCVRTKLNFMAAGMPVPPSLGSPPGFWQTLGIVTKTRGNLDYLVDIAHFSRDVSLSAGVRIAIALAIVKNRMLMPFRPWRRVLRGIGRRITGRPPRRR